MILAKPNHPHSHCFILGNNIRWMKGEVPHYSKFANGCAADWKYWTLIAPIELDTWKDTEDDV